MLRRLIAMRNRLPESERSGIDDIIRACRLRGVECAPVSSGELRGVVATGLDGKMSAIWRLTGAATPILPRMLGISLTK
jgi:hypothetical protein